MASARDGRRPSRRTFMWVDMRGERSFNTPYQAAKAGRRMEDREFLAIFRATRNPEESFFRRKPNLKLGSEIGNSVPEVVRDAAP